MLTATRSSEDLLLLTANYQLGFFSASAAGKRASEILEAPDGRWKSYAFIALENRKVRAAAPRDATAMLRDLAAHSDSTVARWALEELADRHSTPEARAALEALADGPWTKSAEMASRQLRALRGGEDGR